MSSQSVTPEVLWAQRSSSTEASKNVIYLTLMVSDVPENDMNLDLQPNKLSFTGTSTSKKVSYNVELEFFAEIDPKESKIHHTGRDIVLVLRKKELKDEYWPRLLKESKKMHFLKTDFDKWVDEDEQDEQPDDEDFMSKMNPMGGAGGDGGFGGIDFSKLGAAQGMGGLPDMGAMGDMGEGSDDEGDDDDDMPALEGEDKPTKTGESKPQIEEVQ
ncbi:HSP20-like chaperone [Delitschia confertaspora ATCC 74209]|uniref:HSP20-like chaperone n=1 Tax=Delitschia confertaspora ATCC 74209 TaxID=1513339 RepID=A0A9P4MUA1_9PLEO|nr:HSP20-like chaperone [Delitschia confertaspora ATCC 74209]